MSERLTDKLGAVIEAARHEDMTHEVTELIQVKNFIDEVAKCRKKSATRAIVHLDRIMDAYNV